MIFLAACLLAALAASCAWQFVARAADEEDSAPTSVAPRPAATRPASSQPGKGAEELLRKWKWYRATWAGSAGIDSQSRADKQIVDAILKAEPADRAVLRAQMLSEYEHMTKAAKPDVFQCGLVASRITLTWTRGPVGKDLSPVQVALLGRQNADEACRWGLKALQHFAGDVPERYFARYKSFVPSTAASMLSMIAGAGTMIDQPGDVAAELAKIRPNIEKLAKADPDHQALLEQQFQKLFAAVEPFEKLQADKAAVLKLLADFRQAYNGRDGKAFVALWPEGHPAAASMKGKPLADKIDPSVWTIVRWEPVYVIVQGDLAKAFLVSQYRTKDGADAPAVLQGYPAKRHPSEGWKLN